MRILADFLVENDIQNRNRMMIRVNESAREASKTLHLLRKLCLESYDMCLWL